MSDSDNTAENRPSTVSDGMHVRVFTIDAPFLETGRWNARNVQSPYWRFYQNADDGAFLYLADGREYRLHAHRAYFVPAGVRFSCGDEGRAFRHFYVHFDVVGLPSLLMRALFDEPVAVAPDGDFETRVQSFAERVTRASALLLAEQCRAKALVYEGLARCLEEAAPERLAIGLRQAEQMEPVMPALRCIDANLANALSTTLLADLCCMSVDHFARRFKVCVGQTPGEYIREKRLIRAAQRLLFSTDSLDQIAQTCGFGNRNYLTRVFTRVLGVPPATYRQSRRV